MRILIVDDEAAIVEMLTWMLEDAGHVVVSFERADQALAYLHEQGAGQCPVDIVLSDINMPGMTGIELRNRIGDQFPTLPVLLTSGRPPPGSGGAFLPKPFSTETLLSVMRRMLSLDDRSEAVA